MQTIKDRMTAFLLHLGVGQAKFAEICGLSRGFANNVGDSIRSNNADKIAKAYPQLNLDWLLYGKGEMLKDTLPPTQQGSEDYLLVPLYNFDTRGGFTGNNIADYPEYIERHIPFIEARTGDICVPVSGDSMIPVYPPGSIVLLREVSGWREYFGFGNNFMLLLKDGRRIIKRVQKSLEDSRNNVLCVSYNASVDDEELPKSMIKQVFKVIRTLTDEGY